MGTPFQKVGRRLHHGDHAGPDLPIVPVIVARGLGHQLGDRLPGGARQLTQERSMQEERSQHLGDGEYPLCVADPFEDLLLE